MELLSAVLVAEAIANIISRTAIWQTKSVKTFVLVIQELLSVVIGKDLNKQIFKSAYF